MTLVEEILEAKEGETIVRGFDYVMSHDATTPLAIKAFREMGGESVFDASKIALVFDHAYPAPSTAAAELQKECRQFALIQGVKRFEGQGICHQVMIEEGLVRRGSFILGADSHSCTYGAVGALGVGMGSTDIAAAWLTGETWFKVPETVHVEVNGVLREGVSAKDVALEATRRLYGKVDGKAIEYSGSAIHALSLSGRLTLANMIVETGAGTGFMVLSPEGLPELSFDASELEPLAACPDSPINVKPVSELDVVVDQVFIGSCTNGRLEDLEEVYRVLKGNAVKARTVIVPASRKILQEAIARGFVQEFLRAGAVVCNPGCGPCLGRHQGVLAEGEVCVSTSNRNFAGRMGRGEIYLTSPRTAALSALRGRLHG